MIIQSLSSKHRQKNLRKYRIFALILVKHVSGDAADAIDFDHDEDAKGRR